MSLINLTNLPKEAQDYIKKLEAKVNSYESLNPVVKMYRSLLKKMDKLSDLVDTTDIDMADRQNPAFERLMKLMVECKDIAANIKFLKQEFNIGDVEEDSGVSAKPPVEMFAKDGRKKTNY